MSLVGQLLLNRGLHLEKLQDLLSLRRLEFSNVEPLNATSAEDVRELTLSDETMDGHATEGDGNQRGSSRPNVILSGLTSLTDTLKASDIP